MGNGTIVTYRQLDERSKRLAQLFFSKGLRPGDHVAILLENDANPSRSSAYRRATSPRGHLLPASHLLTVAGSTSSNRASSPCERSAARRMA
jgi:non-ribosomal peptide synthetase component F